MQLQDPVRVLCSIGAGADPEEGVVVLIPVSLAPKDSKTKNDNYQYNPTSVVKEINQLGKNQTLKLVKEVCFKPVQLLKSLHQSNLVLVSPGSPGSNFQKTVKDMLAKSSGQLLESVQVDNSRAQTSQSQDFLPRQVDHVCQYVLSCCNSCSFCVYHRASAKERSKSHTIVEQNKACEQCFLCCSMSFCPKCSKCPHCCARLSCRKPPLTVLASLTKVRREPSGSVHSKGGLQPAV